MTRIIISKSRRRPSIGTPYAFIITRFWRFVKSFFSKTAHRKAAVYLAALTDYPAIAGRTVSGGNQNLFSQKSLRMCGCGIVAALDLLLCLQGQGFDAGLRVSDAAGSGIAGYEAAAKMLRRRYLPFFSPIGVTGWTLAWGLNRYFKERGLPFRGRWRMMRRESWKDVEKMLMQNLPVILSIGPNLPFFWKREGVRFDAADGLGSVSISGHYLTVTALEGEKLTAASWGRSFTTSVDLYEAYCRKGLNRLFCGRLQLEKKNSAVK